MQNISFARDIRPLFRQKDIDHMSGWLDLSDYDSVRDNADMIAQRLQGVGVERMPPPPDAPWTPQEIKLFVNWVTQGCLP